MNNNLDINLWREKPSKNRYWYVADMRIEVRILENTETKYFGCVEMFYDGFRIGKLVHISEIDRYALYLKNIPVKCIPDEFGYKISCIEHPNHEDFFDHAELNH